MKKKNNSNLRMSTQTSYELDRLCLQYGLKEKDICNHCADDEVLQTSVKDRLVVIKSNKRKLRQLLKLPKIEQKSEEWYKIRQNLITASDFAQALGQGKFGNQADIIKKKVRPSDESSASFNNPFFKWGNMFEPVANSIYSLLHYNVFIHEFGLIPHKKLKYFGASPDGITDTGIMVEIKCPYKRKIEVGGEVPKQYYYQIQGQLEVCGLTECDYIECQFQLYSTHDEFFKAFDDERIKGIIIEYANIDGTGTHFEYSPLVCTKESTCTSAETEKWLDEHTDVEYVDIKFWYLSHYNLQRVTLDKPFVDEKLKQLEEVWDRITIYRQNPNKYDIEVLKIIDITGTPRFKPLPPPKPEGKKATTSMSGYSFIEDPSE